MNRKFLILFLITTGFLLNACQKDSNIFVPDPGQLNGPDTSWYSTVTATMPIAALKNDLIIPAINDSIQVNNNATYLITASGLQCYFPPNSCVGNVGQAITGTVNVEALLIKTKGDMVRMNRPTTSNGRLLVNGGEVFIRLRKNGTDVQLAPNVKITLRIPDAPLSTQMKFFGGDETNPERFNWLTTTDIANNFIGFNPMGYEINTNHLRWVGCNYFYDTSNITRVTVTANLAAYFTNANTVAFTVFKDFRSVVGMYGDINTRKFSTGLLPVGKAVTVVVISKQGNDYFLGFQDTIVGAPAAGTNSQAVSVVPIKRSLSDILYYLNTL